MVSLLLTLPMKGSCVASIPAGSQRRDDRKMENRGREGQQDPEICAMIFFKKKNKMNKNASET